MSSEISSYSSSQYESSGSSDQATASYSANETNKPYQTVKLPANHGSRYRGGRIDRLDKGFGFGNNYDSSEDSGDEGRARPITCELFQPARGLTHYWHPFASDSSQQLWEHVASFFPDIRTSTFGNIRQGEFCFVREDRGTIVRSCILKAGERVDHIFLKNMCDTQPFRLIVLPKLDVITLIAAPNSTREDVAISSDALVDHESGASTVARFLLAMKKLFEHSSQISNDTWYMLTPVGSSGDYHSLPFSAQISVGYFIRNVLWKIESGVVRVTVAEDTVMPRKDLLFEHMNRVEYENMKKAYLLESLKCSLCGQDIHFPFKEALFRQGRENLSKRARHFVQNHALNCTGNRDTCEECRDNLLCHTNIKMLTGSRLLDHKAMHSNNITTEPVSEDTETQSSTNKSQNSDLMSYPAPKEPQKDERSNTKTPTDLKNSRMSTTGPFWEKFNGPRKAELKRMKQRAAREGRSFDETTAVPHLPHTQPHPVELRGIVKRHLTYPDILEQKPTFFMQYSKNNRQYCNVCFWYMPNNLSMKEHIKTCWTHPDNFLSMFEAKVALKGFCTWEPRVILTLDEGYVWVEERGQMKVKRVKSRDEDETMSSSTTDPDETEDEEMGDVSDVNEATRDDEMSGTTEPTDPSDEELDDDDATIELESNEESSIGIQKDEEQPIERPISAERARALQKHSKIVANLAKLLPSALH